MEDFIKSLTYGSIIPASDIRELAGIIIPERGTFKEFQQAQLDELQFVSTIRDHLLNQGMYLKREGKQYRVLLPSENAQQVERMNESASRKYKRALLLEKLTPKESSEPKQNSSVISRLRDITTRTTRQQLLMN